MHPVCTMWCLLRWLAFTRLHRIMTRTSCFLLIFPAPQSPIYSSNNAFIALPHCQTGRIWFKYANNVNFKGTALFPSVQPSHQHLASISSKRSTSRLVEGIPEQESEAEAAEIVPGPHRSSKKSPNKPPSDTSLTVPKGPLLDPLVPSFILTVST